jgi:outer membrane lipoprotein-sorting protein
MQLTNGCLAFLLLASSVADGQVSREAGTLLQAVSKSAREAKGWRMAGHATFLAERSGARTTVDVPFESILGELGFARTEMRGVFMPGLTVCDQKYTWMYSQVTNSYARMPLSTSCAQPFASWLDLEAGLESAMIDGDRKVEFNGSSEKCINVRAEFLRPSPLLLAAGQKILPGRFTRVMCIDPVRKLILRDEMTGMPMALADGGGNAAATVSVAYTSIEQGVKLSRDLFVFHPPRGSKLVNSLGEAIGSSAVQSGTSKLR